MKAKQIAGTAALIILQTAVFVAFILCSNAVQQRFPVRYMPSVREELRFYMDMEAVLTDMYSVALHAASVIAFFLNRSHRLRGLAWLNLCTIITLCLSFCMQLILGFANPYHLWNLILFPVMLFSVNFLYALLVFGDFLRYVMCERPFSKRNR